MKRTRILCLALCLALLLAALPAALGEADVPRQTRRLRLGSSNYTIEIDESYMFGKVTPESVEEGRVAFLYSAELDVDFDVYQIGASGDQLTLAEFVAREAAARGDADEIVRDAEINGIPIGWFHTKTNEGLALQIATYVLEDGEDYIEIVFRMTDEDAEAEVQGIIGTLARESLVPIRLGSSPYWVFCSDSFYEGGMTSADVADDQVAYWRSEETLLDFDVYQFGKEGLPEALADYVALEAEDFDVDAVVPLTEVNGIPLGWYRTVEEYEGVPYETLTCVLDAGEEYVEIVFWLDGPSAEAEADAILQSLWMDDGAGEADTVFGKAFEAVGTWADHASERTLDAIGAWTERASEDAKDALKTARKWAGAAVDDAGEALEGAREWLKGAVSGLKDTLPGDAAQPDGEDAATRVLRLGSSQFTIVVPAGFIEGELSEEDIRDDQVAYYYSNETLLDFDVYQFGKDGYPDDLAIYVEEETRGYNSVSALVTDGEINGVPAAWYRTVEDYQGVAFDTLTYILDGGEEYVEVVFWLDGDNAEAEADAIIQTLASDVADETLGGEGATLVETPKALYDARATDDAGSGKIAPENPAEDDTWADVSGDGADAIDGDLPEAGE